MFLAVFRWMIDLRPRLLDDPGQRREQIGLAEGFFQEAKQRPDLVEVQAVPLKLKDPLGILQVLGPSSRGGGVPSGEFSSFSVEHRRSFNLDENVGRHPQARYT